MAGPSRPPDTQDLTTRRQRVIASKRSTAYDFTNRIFNLLLSYFGPHALMPMVRWGEGRVQYGTPLPSSGGGAYSKHSPWAASPGRGDVGISLHQLRGLAMLNGLRPGTNAYRRLERGLNVNRQGILDTLIHELAHTQQVGDGDRVEIEGGADAFTDLVRADVFRALGMGGPVNPYWGYRQNYEWQFRNRHPRDYTLFGQFGQRGHG